MEQLYIGLMSGTSADGIDAALVNFQDGKLKLVATHYDAYSPQLKNEILALCEPGTNEIHRLGVLDRQLGIAFAQAANSLLQEAKIPAKVIRALGSHGQTIRHYPHEQKYSIQIADPNTISALTGITTVADFRRKDIALGGEGAPLVPAFHQAIFVSQKPCIILNIGGIANITVLTSDEVLGYDTGPGNILLDAWIFSQQQKTHDKDGAWGALGKIHLPLLQKCLADPFFKQLPPKSTGREYFNLRWLENYLQGYQHQISPIDIQATLTALTAHSIIAAISKHLSAGTILVCGGGAYNTFLMQRLQEYAGHTFEVKSTQRLGFAPEWIEAMAFAWLAKQTLEQSPGNLSCVTGARQNTILGGIYY